MGSVVMGLCCFLRGPGFNSQYLHASLQLPTVLAPGVLMPSSDLWGHQAHTWCINKGSGKTLSHETKQINLT